ncbi:spectrin beta chain, non-erythrocytic 1 [Caerostris extrusa]|uniref:Spectrin beta chain, non-erythrocytic 1 n=1 Tax=Caerostris extrusa TaxID=172846 RepID=A0AAV4P8X5_CAEEX|nr:spectrin beta chain, non-erythrocytic 1 [Caerostris extrusa]
MNVFSRPNYLTGDLKAIEEQMQALSEEAASLTVQFPDSRDDIQTKELAVLSSWKKCTEKAAIRKDKLQQAEQLQSYFDEARDFHAWIYEMSALITSAEVPEDIVTCETLLVQHEGYKSEIDARFRSFDIFEARGKEIIASGHFLSQDIQTKIDALSSSLNDLLATWNTRRDIYEQTLDLQKLIELETWLNTQEHNLTGEDGRSVEEVEYLIQKYEQFEKKIQLYEAKFQELERSTKIEEDASRLREEKERQKLENERILEQQRLEEIRRKEEERLLEERRKERVPSDVTQREDSYDDNQIVDSSASNLKRIGSTRISVNHKKASRQEQSSSIALNLPIINKKRPTVVKKESIYKKREVPPTTAEGFLSRKQERESNGKRSTSRQWKTLYTVLCGQLLCFFKDKKAFVDSNSAKPPVNILKANCYVPRDYHKKKYVFRLELSDNSSYLFEAQNDIKRQEWMQKINFTASLPPRQQLLSPKENEQFEISIKEESQKTIEELYSTIESKSSEPSDIYDVPEVDDSESLYDTPTETYQGYKFPEMLDTYRDRVPSSVYENTFKTSPVAEEHDPFGAPRTMEEIYGDPSFYVDPFADNDERFSLDENPQSARSSVSNQSSYVTAASNSSISTLQDERMDDIDSDDEQKVELYATTLPRGSRESRGSYPIPPPTPRGSYAEESTPQGSFSNLMQVMTR